MNGASLVSLLLASVAGTTMLSAQDQVEIVNGESHAVDAGELVTLMSQWFPKDRDVPVSPSPAELQLLLRNTLDSVGTLSNERDFYCIVHLVNWADKTVSKQVWLLYRGNPRYRSYPLGPSWSSKNVLGQRLYGATKVGLLYVYQHPPQGSPTYKVSVTKKTPTPLQDLGSLIQYSLSGPGVRASPTVTWGGRVLAIRFRTSDIAVDASIPTEHGEEALQSIGKQMFDNEGRTRWDVSVGLPVHSVSELSYNSEGGVVTTRKVEREKAYAILDFYPFPVDPRGTGFQYVPLMFGVSIASKPFDHLLLATGVGIKAVRVFVGAALNNDHKPKTLQPGDSASTTQLDNAQRAHYSAKLVIGLNVSLRQLLGAAKSASTNK